MERVRGECPRGCGQTLFLGSGGFVTCSYDRCPEPDAAASLLENTVVIRRAVNEVHRVVRDIDLVGPLEQLKDAVMGLPV